MEEKRGFLICACGEKMEFVVDVSDTEFVSDQINCPICGNSWGVTDLGFNRG